MKSSATVLIAAFLANVINAAPSSNFLSRRGAPPDSGLADASGDFYNKIWAGASIDNAPTGSFTMVSGQFVLPKASFPDPNGPHDKEHGAAIWVGIGANPLLQAGVDTLISPNGDHQFSAWYEWFPKPSHPLTGLDLAAGDTIEVVIHTDGPDAKGNVTIHNHSKQKSAHQEIDSPGHHGDMTANWIVEDYTVGNGLEPFADFGSVTFTNCVAKTSGGTYGLGRAHPDDIEQNNKKLTKSTIESDSKLTVKYIG